MDVYTIKNNNIETVYMKNGKTHRDERDPETGLTLPAIETIHGSYWYKDGLRHREDKDENGMTLPACDMFDCPGDFAFIHKEWYQHGERHRDDPEVVDASTTSLMPAVERIFEQMYINYSSYGNSRLYTDRDVHLEYWVRGVQTDKYGVPINPMSRTKRSLAN